MGEFSAKSRNLHGLMSEFISGGQIDARLKGWVRDERVNDWMSKWMVGTRWIGGHSKKTGEVREVKYVDGTKINARLNSTSLAYFLTCPSIAHQPPSALILCIIQLSIFLAG